MPALQGTRRGLLPPGVPPKILRAVATRGVAPSGIFQLGGASDSNYTRFESRLVHYNGPDPITAFQVAVPAYFMTAAGGEAAMPYPYTAEIGLEYNGATTLATWGGVTSKAIATSPTGLVWSDMTPIATIPAYAQFFERAGALVASGQYIYASDQRAASTTLDTFVRSTTAASQVGNTGALVTTGGSSSNIGCFCAAMIVAYRASGAKAVMLLGDSILFGTGDAGGGDGNGNMGYPARAVFIGDGAGHPLPYSKFGRPTETASNMVGTKGDIRRSAMPYHSLLLSEFGTNDLGQASATITPSPLNKAATVASLQANLKNAIWAPAKTAGLKVYQCLYTPRVLGPTITALTSSGTVCTATVANTADLPTIGATVTVVGAAQSAYNGSVVVTSVDSANKRFTYNAASTPAATPATVGTGTAVITWNDGFTTLANQRPVDGYEPGGALRDPMNSFIVASVGTLIDGYFDANAAVEDATGGTPTGRWIVTGGAQTTDGLHPVALGATNAAFAIAAKLWAAA